MTLSRASASALGLGLGYLADGLLGDPRRGHPVAGFGTMAAALERRCYADDRRAGVAYVLTLVGGVTILGVGLSTLVRRDPWLNVAVTAAAAWAVLGGRSLRHEATVIGRQLLAEDLDGARRQVRNLVGRDPSELSSDEVARACVESVAENTSDAVVAPLLWGAVAGPPGLLAYRAVNTLDAMVGHRSARYRNFGWAAARLDDLANWVPARVAAGLTIVSAGLVRGSPAEAWTAMRRDAGRHPSPNAGVVEAAFAGALHVRLGGRNVYHGRVEDRGTLGDGPGVTSVDIPRATRLSVAVSTAAAALAIAVRVLRR
jgi:adenosylcobinamide-phosphate synthase